MTLKGWHITWPLYTFMFPVIHAASILLDPVDIRELSSLYIYSAHGELVWSVCVLDETWSKGLS